MGVGQVEFEPEGANRDNLKSVSLRTRGVQKCNTWSTEEISED